MSCIKFKPESFQFFCNSKIYYVTGVVLDTVVQNDKVVLKKGSICQLCFDSSTPYLEIEKLFNCQILRPKIDTIRDCRVKGRRGLRLTVTRFDENDIWFDC